MATRIDQSRAVIDFGSHIYPDGHLPPSEDNPDAGLDEHLGPIHHDPDLVLDRMDAAGVDVMVLSMPYYMGHGDAARVAAANDALLDIVAAEERFLGLAAIPVAAGPEAAAAELERCLDAGFNGGALETTTESIGLADDETQSVLGVASDRGAPLLVHPKLDESLHPEVLDDTYKLNAIFGREAALSESICRVIHQGVLDRHEDLNLVFHHFGGNIASMLGRIHLQLDEGRWPGQEATKPYPAFKRQLEERVFVDTSGFFGYHQPLQATLSEFPGSQVVFATDGPYEPRSPEELARMVESVEAVTAERDADEILGGNALGLLVNVD